MFSLDEPLPPPVDYSRHDGLLDHALLDRTHVACIGAGGASGLVQLLTRCGIPRWTLVDFDLVSATNPATQAHDHHDIHRSKVFALADRLTRIDGRVEAKCICKRYQDLTPDEQAALWAADLVLAMTDDFTTQARINRDAVAAGTDCIFAITYLGCQAVEVTATFPDTIAAGGGCHRCHVKGRYDAYAAGFQNPALVESHALAAEYLNALLATIVVGRLHQRAASPLTIAEIGRVFAERPCLISRLAPAFGGEVGEAFGGEVGEAFAGAPPLFFTTSLWSLDTPSSWTCPDCGTAGVVSELPRPTTDGGQGTTEERREPCADPCNLAASAVPDNT